MWHQQDRILPFLCVLFFVTCQSVYALSVDKIVIFGDSLSDNGNIYALTTRASHIIPNVNPMPKSPPYYYGRFSNGLVWVEHLAQFLHAPLQDYAFGGSWAEPYQDSHNIIPFGLATQVSMYLADDEDNNNRKKHLFIIWSGGNDYTRGRNDIEYATSNTVTSIRNQIELLISAGAKHFLILTLPDLGTVPGVMKRGESTAKNATILTQLHNQKLVRMLKLEKKANPNVDFVLFNMGAYMKNIAVNPEKYSISNTQDPCYKGTYTMIEEQGERVVRTNKAANQANINIDNNLSLQTVMMNSLAGHGLECANPDEYMYWDTMHPTRRMHQLMASTVYNMLSKVN